MAKETISMVGKDFEVTCKEDWLQKAVSARKDWLCIWRNMFGDPIIEMLVFNDRKNSFLNHLKGVMFSGSFYDFTQFIYGGRPVLMVTFQVYCKSVKAFGKDPSSAQTLQV